MCLVSPCTTQYLKRSVKRYSVKMVDSSEKGSADIIKSDSGRVFMTQRTLVGMQTVWSSILHLSIWLCVLSRIISAWCAVCSMGRTESWHPSENGDMT